MTAATLADAAVDARAGRDLVRVTLSDRIPDSAFATSSRGVVTINGLDVLKAGTFNGFQILAEDLDVMVARFAQLRESGTFVPPFRLDHSWSVLSVVGYFNSLETYTRTDLAGVENTFLRGDLELTGSLDYEPAAIVAACKRGSLRNRSAEIGSYLTNAGVELPLVFYGAAFVDIPAVEGLAPVGLSRGLRLSTPRSITTLTTEGFSPMSDTDDTTTTSTGDPAPADAGEAGTTVEAGEVGQDSDPARSDDPATPDESGTGTAGDPPPDPETVAGGDPGDPAPSTTPDAAAGDPDPDDGTAAELERLRSEIVRLRQADVDRRVETLRAAGAITAANEAAAVALLSHDDEDVRRSAGTILDHSPTAVRLGHRPGRIGLDAGNGETIRLGMSKDEVGPLWASLTPDDRRARQAEYDAWSQHRRDNGIRD